jgi:hypothetical protein
MAGAPVLYNLFWAAIPGAPIMGAAAGRGFLSSVPLGRPATLKRPPPVEALILYPAFLTPAVCSKEQNAFELLLLAPRDPVVKATLVNRHLKISRGLDPLKWATSTPLFDVPLSDDLLEVTKLGLLGGEVKKDGLLETSKLFRGIVDERFWDAMSAWEKRRSKDPARKDYPKLDTLYRVRIASSCIERAAGPAPAERARLDPSQPPRGMWTNVEPQDEMIVSILRRKNGPALGRDEKGAIPDSQAPRRGAPGLHCFTVSPNMGDERLGLASPDPGQPIRAYHPLFVYGDLAYANLGHVADLHINSRQHFLARSPARVVEGDPGPWLPDAEANGSPPIRRFVNIYADNLLSILARLAESKTKGSRGRPPIDALLVGGDLIDHAVNVYPYGRHSEKELRSPTPAKVWDIVSLADGAPSYELGVDYLAFYSIMRHFCAEYERPAFVVSGNHDAYEAPYGISPRPLGVVRGNAGIPADHNLTFYEALLAFGESYGEVTSRKSIWLREHLFEWFYGVFTPFRDYAVDLPHQRVVGLAWGDDEQKLVPVDSDDAHGYAHLPRANEAALNSQWELLKRVVSRADKKVVLLTHFTFVSYINPIANMQAPSLPRQRRAIARADADLGKFQPVRGSVGESSYSNNDYGTFQQNRSQLYGKIHEQAAGAGTNGPHVQCVLTGHSHRKGIYFLTDQTTRFRLINTGDAVPERVFGTLMYPMHEPELVSRALEGNASRTPIIVSDSAGPVPRMNVHGELGEWGSDRPAGTFVGFSANGVVDRVEPVPTQVTRARPRPVVAIDYWHVQEGKGIESIMTGKWEWNRPFLSQRHWLVLKFDDEFPRNSVAITSGMLHYLAVPSVPWVRIPLAARLMPSEKALIYELSLESGYNAKFRSLLQAKGVPCFLQLQFQAVDDLVGRVYDFANGGTWSFEIVPKPAGILKPQYELKATIEIPNFDLRKKWFPDQYTLQGKR